MAFGPMYGATKMAVQDKYKQKAQQQPQQPGNIVPLSGGNRGDPQLQTTGTVQPPQQKGGYLKQPQQPVSFGSPQEEGMHLNPDYVPGRDRQPAGASPIGMTPYSDGGISEVGGSIPITDIGVTPGDEYRAGNDFRDPYKDGWNVDPEDLNPEGSFVDPNEGWNVDPEDLVEDPVIEGWNVDPEDIRNQGNGGGPNIVANPEKYGSGGEEGTTEGSPEVPRDPRIDDYLNMVFGDEASFDPQRELMEEERDRALRQSMERMAAQGMLGTGAAGGAAADIMRGSARDIAQAQQEWHQQQVQNASQAAQMLFQDEWKKLGYEQQKAMAELMFELDRKRKFGDRWQSGMGDYDMEIIMDMLQSGNLSDEAKDMLQDLLDDLYGEQRVDEWGTDERTKDEIEKELESKITQNNPFGGKVWG